MFCTVPSTEDSKYVISGVPGNNEKKMDKDKSQQELIRLKASIENIEKEVTLLLQNLQWDPKYIIEKRSMVSCQHDPNHRIPLDNRDTHEKQCRLTKLGYRKDETFLPDPVDPDANTLVKFSKLEIAEIIRNAALHNPIFKRGCQGPEPLTVERLQSVYTADERRAIHDAVVNAAPFCHDLTDLDLLSSNNDAKESQKKSRLEILAELRNMKRRRTKYRVAPKTRNYSDVLRDVIKTQMDSYGEATRTIIKTEYGQNVNVSQKVTNMSSENFSPHDAVIKLERESPESQYYSRYQRENHRERYRARSREKRYNDDRRACRKDNISSKERDKSKGLQSEISGGSTERSQESRHDDNGRKHHNDKYSKERSRNYDKQQRGNTRDREKTYDDYRFSEHSLRDRSKNYEDYKRDIKSAHDIKKERASEESESYTYDRNRNRSIEKRHRDSGRCEKYQKQHTSAKVIKQERDISPDLYNNTSDGESSRKRRRSRSKERRHNDKKRRHDKDKHSSKRDREEI